MREAKLIARVMSLTGNFRFERPLSVYLKNYFRNNPVMGARDRRETREWVYNFYRIGENLITLDFEQRLCVACFLCSQSPYPALTWLISQHSEFRIDDITLPLKEKIKIVVEKHPDFELKKIFPMHRHLTHSINQDEWCESFLIKPSVWIRVRKKFLNEVLNEFNERKIPFSDSGIPLVYEIQPDVALDKTLSWERGYFEIQDISSQETKDFFNPTKGESWLDACAGSGGKSLLLLEECSDLKLSATDNRPQIIDNYKRRLKKAGFSGINTRIADLSKEEITVENAFDGIIADVPCSGSGTWSRNPEWLKTDISDKLINYFIPLQRKIMGHLVQVIKSGRPIIYITCSAFFEENEQNIQFFVENLPLNLEKSAYIQGFKRKADTLFVARLVRK